MCGCGRERDKKKYPPPPNRRPPRLVPDPVGKDSGQESAAAVAFLVGGGRSDRLPVATYGGAFSGPVLVVTENATVSRFDALTRLLVEEHHGTGCGTLAEFCILTAARSGEVLGLRSEIDMDKKIWTVPAEWMKPGREHRVPLAPRAITILKKLAKPTQGEFVFPGRRQNRPLSGMSMEMVLRRMRYNLCDRSCLRSSFRDWAGNVSNSPREIMETALSHVIGNQAEQAYRRSDALDKRRKLMDAWADYCEPRATDNVVQLKG